MPSSTLWRKGRAAWRGAAPLWTHFGVSGPAALNASRHWARAQLTDTDSRLTVSFRPGHRFEAIDERLSPRRRRGRAHRRRRSFPSGSRRQSRSDRFGRLHRRSATVPTPARGSPPPRRTRSPAGRRCGGLGTRGYTYAEVTAGGVPLDDIDPATLLLARLPRSVAGRRNPRRRRTAGRLELSMGMVERVRCRARTRSARPERR